MAFALVAHTSTHASVSVTTTGIDTTGANLLVAVTDKFTGNTNIVTDNKSNTWHELTTQNANSGVAAIYYAFNATVGTGHTFTISNNFSSICVAAFSGAQTTGDPFDVQNGSSSASATSLAAGSVTPTVDNELVIYGGCGNWSGTLSVSVGTILESIAVTSDFASSIAYQIQTTATAVNPNFSWTGGSSAATAVIATFKAASGGGGGSTTSLFRQNQLNGLGSGGPFFNNPLGRSMLGWRPKLVTA